MNGYAAAYKNWVLLFLSICIIVLAGQFVLFRWETVFSLNLRTRLYDHAAWIRKSPVVLIMGSSQARYGVVPALISNANSLDADGAVNVGSDAGTPFEMYMTYKKRRNILSKAKVVYYTIDPWVFSSKYYRYKKYEKLFLNYQQWHILSQDQKIINEYLVPVRLFIDSLVFKKEEGTPFSGYMPLNAKIKFLSDAEFLTEYEPYREFPIARFQCRYLRKLKDAVEQDGGTFICLFTPKHRTWYQRYARYCPVYDKDFVTIFNEEVGAVRVIGSNFDTSYGLKDEDFTDSIHMNDAGARRFTAAEFADISKHRTLTPQPLRSTLNYSAISP